MSSDMRDTVESVFGVSAGTGSIPESFDPVGSREYWRNNELRKGVITRLLENTHFLFDKELVDHSPDSYLETNKGDSTSFRIVSIQSKLLREDEILSGRAALLTAKMLSDDGGILIPVSKVASQEIENKRVEQLTDALKEKPDFVSFCEFALPPVCVEEIECKDDCDVFSIKTEAEIDKKFTLVASRIRDRSLAGIENSKMPFIFYGSAHCTLSRYNIGVVSPGGGLEKGWEIRRVRTHPFESERKEFANTELGSGPMVHKKRAPARRAGERARVPEAHGFRLYRHPLGLISVLICSDALDINQFSNIVRFNNDADNKEENERIFMVMIPAYNFSKILLDACRDLSLSARTNVLVTNASGESNLSRSSVRRKSLPPSELYFMGRPSSELVDSDVGIISKESKTGDLWVIDIDLRKQAEILDKTKADFFPIPVSE